VGTVEYLPALHATQGPKPTLFLYVPVAQAPQFPLLPVYPALHWQDEIVLLPGEEVVASSPQYSQLLVVSVPACSSLYANDTCAAVLSIQTYIPRIALARDFVDIARLLGPRIRGARCAGRNRGGGNRG